MSLSLTCPECGGQLKVADNLAGKKIKCPKCSAIFAVDAPPPAPAAESVGITPEAIPPMEAEELPSRPARLRRDIRRDPSTEAVATLIPYRNARALIAYYCGVFSVIPCAGLVLGPIAFILGILGMRYVKANPGAHGTGHAITGIILGALTSLANWGVVIAGLIGGGLAALSK